MQTNQVQGTYIKHLLVKAWSKKAIGRFLEGHFKFIMDRRGVAIFRVNGPVLRVPYGGYILANTLSRTLNVGAISDGPTGLGIYVVDGLTEFLEY